MKVNGEEVLSLEEVKAEKEAAIATDIMHELDEVPLGGGSNDIPGLLFIIACRLERVALALEKNNERP